MQFKPIVIKFIYLQNELRRTLHETLEQPEQGCVRVLVDHQGVILDPLVEGTFALGRIRFQLRFFVSGPPRLEAVAHRVDVPEHRSELKHEDGKSDQPSPDWNGRKLTVVRVHQIPP